MDADAVATEELPLACRLGAGLRRERRREREQQDGGEAADQCPDSAPGLRVWEHGATAVALPPLAGRDPLGPTTGTEVPEAARGSNGGTTSTPRIAFSAFTQSSNLYRVNLDGTGYGLIPNGENGSGPVWSPDGSRILFIGQVDSTHSVIQVIRPNGRDRRELTSVDGQSRWHPTWSPDGGRIAYEEYHTLGSRLMR